MLGRLLLCDLLIDGGVCTHCVHEYNRQERLTPEQVRKKELKQERKDKKKAAAGLLVGRR